MPYFCATVKVLVEDDSVEKAKTTILEGMNFLKDDQNVLLDWGFCLDVPSGKGPYPRLVSTEQGEQYEENMNALFDSKVEEEKEQLRDENDELFKRL